MRENEDADYQFELSAGEILYNKVGSGLHEFMVKTKSDDRDHLLIYIPQMYISILMNHLWRKGWTQQPGENRFMGVRIVPGYESRLVIAHEDAALYPDHILKIEIHDRHKSA